MTALPPLDTLPAAARHRIRRRLMATLVELGIVVRMDPASGELVVPIAELAARLGMTEAEVRGYVGPHVRDLSPGGGEVVQ